MLAMATAFTSCSNDDAPSEPNNLGGTAMSTPPHWEVTPNTRDVYNWVVDEEVHSILNNMIVLGEVPAQLCDDDADNPAADRIGFFADNECVGVADHTIPYEGRWLYMAQVYEPINFNTDITIAYKDASTGITYYWPDTMPYTNNGVVGEISEPFTLDISKAQTYPEQILVDVALPQDMAEYVSPDDELAIFCGEQCRGVFDVTTDRIRGNAFMVEKDEEMQFRYYSASRKLLYTTAPFAAHLGDVVIYYRTIELK